MNRLLAEPITTVDECLQRHGGTLEPAGHGRWDVKIADGRRPLWAVMESDGQWLRFKARQGRAARPRFSAERFSRLLRCNARLPGGVTFAMELEPGDSFLAAEIPLHEQIDLEPRVRDVCAGLRQGRAEFVRVEKASAGGRPAPPPVDDAPRPEVSSEAELDWAALCGEAGWPCADSRRAGGSPIVSLEVRGALCQAHIERADSAGYRVRTELDIDPSASDTTRKAVGVLLLLACGAVRMARATAVPIEDHIAYGWEVALSETPAVEELRHAFSALSVACRFTVREVQALHDEFVARRYLTHIQSASLPLTECCS